jgi:hypothetical protein
MTTGKRTRNTRPSKYRPRTDAQKAQRQALIAARAQDRSVLARERETAELQARFAELDTVLRDGGRSGIHGRRNSRPLESITDDAERLAVLKARVERLEALWTVQRRKRETRGKIVLGEAILAELAAAKERQGSGLSKAVLDVLDRRVETIRDRMTLRDLLGGAPLPLRRGGALDEDTDAAIKALGASEPAFDLSTGAGLEEDEPEPFDDQGIEYDTSHRAT